MKQAGDSSSPNGLTPFYFLKCEHKDNGAPASSTDDVISRATCTLRVYGKGEDGNSIAVELHNYQPDFFVSFRNREVCMRVLKRIKERSQSHIKGVETATGYSSLIIHKDHQNGNGQKDYGDTRLSFTFRVYVRCFSHIRAAVREILEISRETAVERGVYSGVGDLKRDVHFYESSLDPNVRLAERLQLRPCQWCWLDTKACLEMSTSPKPPPCPVSLKRLRTFTYDFAKQIDTAVLKHEGRIKVIKPPFVAATPGLENKLPPPVSVMSFDIECLTTDISTFPTPDVCEIIQIATVTAPDALNRSEYNGSSGVTTKIRKRLYTVGDCETLDDVTTLKCFDNERSMLIAFCADLVEEDPDIITGYYIENFDFPFLFARMAFLNLTPAVGRLGLVATCVKNGPHETEGRKKKYTSYTPKTNFTSIDGRTIFDACVFVRKEFSMRSYTLNAVSEHFLNARKDDVHYTQIPTLFNSGPQGRAVLGRYCVKDAQLVMDLVFHLQAFATMYERCKVFNTTLEYLLDRGQQVRIISMLLKWCSGRRILINDCTTADSVFYNGISSDMRERLYDRIATQSSSKHDSVHNSKKRKHGEPQTCGREDASGDGSFGDGGGGGGGDDDGNDRSETAEQNKEHGGKTKNSQYEGAVVIEPKRGLYHDPIVCLDYASLYPSIMIAYNLCYSTMILDTKHGHDAVENGTAVRSPVGHYFLKAEFKKGALPSILETLISTRSEVRRRMSDLDRESVDYMLLNGQQGALKIAANSIYGATGCQGGKLYFLQIPSSVTAYGRGMITATKESIETKYRDREVIYGDTDSVMVRMIGWTAEQRKHLWDCTEAGNEMADTVTRLIDRPPIKLQFETVYMPFLLANKKRYAAGVYKSLDQIKSLAASEGVEAARKALIATERQITCKGLEVVRRDNCVLAKNTLQKTIDMIMSMRKPEEVVETLQADMRQLLRGDVNIQDLIISKEWTKRTKNPTPHDCLAQKMALRNPGEAPQLGDRIQYIVVASHAGGRTGKICDRAEDPLYVLEHGLPIDYTYYANNQLLNPLVNVLGIAMPHYTKEELKDALWPSNGKSSPGTLLPERPNQKQNGNTKRTRRNSKHNVMPHNNRLITTYLKRPLQDVTSDTVGAGSQNPIDIEDICTRLERECLACKQGDVAATASCKNRDCSLLYERYTQKRRIRHLGCNVVGKSFARVLGI